MDLLYELVVTGKKEMESAQNVTRFLAQLKMSSKIKLFSRKRFQRGDISFEVLSTFVISSRPPPCFFFSRPIFPLFVHVFLKCLFSDTTGQGIVHLFINNKTPFLLYLCELSLSCCHWHWLNSSSQIWFFKKKNLRGQRSLMTQRSFINYEEMTRQAKFFRS